MGSAAPPPWSATPRPAGVRAGDPSPLQRIRLGDLARARCAPPRASAPLGRCAMIRSSFEYAQPRERTPRCKRGRRMLISESRGLLSRLWLEQNNRLVNAKRDFESAAVTNGLTTQQASNFCRFDVGLCVAMASVDSRATFGEGVRGASRTGRRTPTVRSSRANRPDSHKPVHRHCISRQGGNATLAIREAS